jgi:hypothetical protein
MVVREPYISGWKTCSDWSAFRETLLKAPSENLWREAFRDYFEQRLNLRYFNPIKILQENGTFAGEGFSIMAILCTLVEYLESTARGLKYRYVRDKEDLAEFEYNLSAEIFVDFLSKREPFSKIFDDDFALDFYKNVRCGLLHEAHTKGRWTIWAKSPDGSIVDKKKKIVYRDDFEKAFKVYIAGYEICLLTDVALQRAFIRKFDFICEET